MLMTSEESMASRQLLLFTRTCLESSATEPTPLATWLEVLQAKTYQLSHQGSGGRTLVVCLDPKEQWRGDSSTPNFSPWPNDAAACSLSQVLEKGSIPQRFFLSGTACEGILRRAEKRGKALPDALHAALRSVAEKEGGQSNSETMSEAA